MMFASFSDLLARVGALELTLLLLIGFCIGAGFVCALVFGAGFFWPKPAPSVYVPPGPGLDIDAITAADACALCRRCQRPPGHRAPTTARAT